jgi:hypothetical protein
MRPKTQGLMPRAHFARGEVRGALPRIPARGTPPETPAAFPFHCEHPGRSSPSRVRCAEQKTLALDRSGPFRRLAPKKGKAAHCKSPHGLPSVGPRAAQQISSSKTS